jgi:cytochrome c oxidase subunit 2
MFEDLAFFPPSASTMSERVDAIYLFLVGVSVFFVLLILAAIVVFSVRYRRARHPRAEAVEGSIPLEIFWTSIPLLIVLVAFGWGAKLYLEIASPPDDAMQFSVTGKQWMWKVQHPTGQSEINALHVPAHEPIVLTMISQDVIHDFFVPAFRVKADVLPGAYTRIWFEATKVGTYHLFCAEYCGTKHSQMIGEVVVMEPGEYQRWLSGQPAGQDPVETGRILFENNRCDTCHTPGPGQRGPELAGLFGEQVLLESGQAVLFDEEYVRESILEPKRRITKGFEPLMPSYRGQLGEEQILALIAYIKSLAKEDEAER